MDKKLSKKLTLNKETVKNLNVESGVQAGGLSFFTQGGLSVCICPISYPCVTKGTCPGVCQP